jgi:hypothetical protein
MMCGKCDSFLKCGVRAADTGCEKYKDWRQGMEKECCELCGGDLNPSLMSTGFERTYCANVGCPLNAGASEHDMNRIQKALALLKRIESGNAVVIEKNGVELPFQVYGYDNGESGFMMKGK